MQINLLPLNRSFALLGWSPLWFAMAVLILAWSWFNPYVYYPWTDFSKDTHIALCFVLASVFWYWRYKGELFDIPAAAAACMLLVCVVALQWGLGYYAYGEQAVWAITALAAIALICILAAKLTPRQSGLGLTALLCTAIVLAALLNLAVAVAQRFGFIPDDFIDLPGLLMPAALNPMRPGGNLGQPNVFATFMVWGVLAGGWMHCQQQIGRLMCVALSVVFCFGMALAQSRVVAVILVVLVLLSWMGTRHLVNRWRPLYWMLGCLMVYLVSTVILFAYAQWMNETGVRSAIFSDRIRHVIYTTYFDASLLKPLLGWGMKDLAEVQWTVWPRGEGSGVLYLHAHNIALDLALWVGWPVTMIVVCWLGWRAWSRLRSIEDTSNWCAFAILTALFVHASFELPHMMAFYFLPAAWWVGVLSSRSVGQYPLKTHANLSHHIKMPGMAGLAMSLGLGIYLAVIVWEYSRIEPEFWRIRFEYARIGTPKPPDLPSTLLLTPLAERITLQATACQPNMSNAQIAQLERSTRGFPTLYSLFLTACASGLAGQTERAQLWMSRLNRIASPEQVAEYAQVWEQYRLKFPTVVTEPWPALATLHKSPN